MTIYKSIYQEIGHNGNDCILRETFFPASSQYTIYSFTNDFTKLANEVMKLKGKIIFKSILLDIRQLSFTVVPGLQVWHEENIFPKIIEMGIRKMAIVSGIDVYASISTEQVFNAYNQKQLETQYFTSIKSAETWLLS